MIGISSPRLFFIFVDYMKIGLEYDWVSESESVENQQTVFAVREITCMMVKGCSTKILKSKMKRLDSFKDVVI